MRILYLFVFLLFNLSLNATEKPPWSSEYQSLLMEKIGTEAKNLATYPSTNYPNKDAQSILNKYPNGKVLLFGYGSLINKESAGRSVSPEALNSMQPVAAFGFKRMFNYKTNNPSPRWGINLPENERAMLNIEPMTTFKHVINGVTMEVDQNDLQQLISRETGYDLVPLLVADWNELISENPDVQIKVAYTFYVPDELRNGIDYTQTKYYPVRGYLHAVQEGASLYGEDFLNYWNKTTYLGDGTTPVYKWDEQTFSGILDTKEP